MTSLAEPHREPGGSYVEFFNFVEVPFHPSPNPRFECGCPSRARALETVTTGIGWREGLIVITGDEGTGKTTLCLALPRYFGPRASVSVILAAPLTPDGLVGRLLADFGIAAFDSSDARTFDDAKRQEQYDALQGFLLSLASVDGHAVVVIDDAHALSASVLSEILRLSNFEENHPGLLQIVLVGRPNLEEVLRQPGVSQLGQRIVRRYDLPPLTKKEVRQFIERQLWIAHGGIAALPARTGSENAQNARTGAGPRFTNAAVAVIASRSSGNPRIINMLCDRVLTIALERATDRVSGGLARRAAVDLGLGSRMWQPSHKAAAAIVLTIAVGALLTAVLQQRGRVHATSGVASSLEALSLSPVQPFQTFRREVLQRAVSLSKEPNVRALLSLQDEVHLWDGRTKYASHLAVEALLVEVERLTNDARKRQLDRDGRLILEDSRKPPASH